MIHPPERHDKVSPFDLWWHINDEHTSQVPRGVMDVDMNPVPAHEVETWLVEHGIESAGDPDTDRLLMWHEIAHRDEAIDDDSTHGDTTR